jgi:predicted nucleic acid-binding Zn ribbon protein
MDRTERHRLTHFARWPTSTEKRREATMAEWYGEDLAVAEIACRRSSARPLAEILDETLRQIGLGDACILDRVRGLWPSLVGADVARQSRPLAFRDRVLTVEVVSASWLYVLEREHREHIRDRLREATADAVMELRLVPPGRWPRPQANGPNAAAARGA